MNFLFTFKSLSYLFFALVEVLIIFVVKLPPTNPQKENALKLK